MTGMSDKEREEIMNARILYWLEEESEDGLGIAAGAWIRMLQAEIAELRLALDEREVV